MAVIFRVNTVIVTDRWLRSNISIAHQKFVIHSNTNSGRKLRQFLFVYYLISVQNCQKKLIV